MKLCKDCKHAAYYYTDRANRYDDMGKNPRHCLVDMPKHAIIKDETDLITGLRYVELAEGAYKLGDTCFKREIFPWSKPSDCGPEAKHWEEKK